MHVIWTYFLTNTDIQAGVPPRGVANKTRHGTGGLSRRYRAPNAPRLIKQVPRPHEGPVLREGRPQISLPLLTTSP